MAKASDFALIAAVAVLAFLGWRAVQGVGSAAADTAGSFIKEVREMTNNITREYFNTVETVRENTNQVSIIPPAISPDPTRIISAVPTTYDAYTRLREGDQKGFWQKGVDAFTTVLSSGVNLPFDVRWGISTGYQVATGQKLPSVSDVVGRIYDSRNTVPVVHPSVVGAVGGNPNYIYASKADNRDLYEPKRKGISTGDRLDKIVNAHANQGGGGGGGSSNMKPPTPTNDYWQLG